MKKIAILVPIRTRLKHLEEMVKTWKETTEGKSQLIFGIDDDDTTYDEFMKQNPQFIYHIAPRRPTLQWLNVLAIEYCEEYDYLCFFEDDLRFRTDKWETTVINALDGIGGIGIVYGEDQLNHDRIVGCPFITSNIVKRLGKMVPNSLNFLWADYYWKKLGDGIGRLKYIPEIVIEHLHHSTKKSDPDAVSANIDAHGQIDYEIWNTLSSEIEEDINVVKQLIGEK